MVEIICVLCGKNQQTEVLFKENYNKNILSPIIYSARRLPDRVHYRILKCTRCGLIFSSPIFPSTQIKKLYKNSVCTYKEQIPYLIQTYKRLFKKAVSTLASQSFELKILEIGCGNGFFLDALKQEGYRNMYGVEPSQKMVAQAPIYLRKNILQDVFKKNQFPKNSFDLICCFHTLDHVVDPLFFVKNTYGILKKGGAAVFVVHDAEGLSVKLFGEKSAIFDIEHIYLFNKKTLPALFRKGGFKTSNVFEVQNTYPLWYWFRMSGVPKLIRKVGEKIMTLSGIGSIPLSLNGGNIGIIAKK